MSAEESTPPCMKAAALKPWCQQNHPENLHNHRWPGPPRVLTQTMWAGPETLRVQVLRPGRCCWSIPSDDASRSTVPKCYSVMLVSDLYREGSTYWPWTVMTFTSSECRLQGSHPVSFSNTGSQSCLHLVVNWGNFLNAQVSPPNN